MWHPAEGTLRRLLDEPLSVALRDREHCASCARCTERLAAMAADARGAERAMQVPEFPLDPAAAYAQTAQRATPTGARASTDLPPVQMGGPGARLPLAWRRPFRVATALVAAALLVGALAATGTADALLTIFQPRQVSVVTVTPSDFSALPDLSAYGTLTWTTPPSEHAVAGLTEAAQETGQTVLGPAASLPSGVDQTPTIHVFPATSGSFTFDPTRAAAAAAAAGATLPPMPPDIADTTLYGSVGPAVLQVYHATGATNAGAGAQLGLGTLPALVIGQTRAPTISTTGVSFEVLRNYLLEQPGMSPSLAAQLRALGDPAQTLPIPVPASGTVTRNVTVRGVQGVWIGDSSGLGGGVIWQQGGIIYGVGGMFSEQQILKIADALH